MDALLTLLQAPTVTPSINCQNFPPACITNISALASFLLPLLYVGSAMLLLFILLYAGYLYLKSGSDPGNVTRAQSLITYSIVGIILIFLAYFLTRVVAYVFNIDFVLGP